MLRAYETAIVRLRTHACAEDQAKDTTALVVKFLCCIFTLTQSFEIRIGHVIISVAVAGCTAQTVGPCTHLDVKTVEDCLFAVAASAPVADHNAVESPFSLEDVYKKLLVVAVELTVVEVV